MAAPISPLARNVIFTCAMLLPIAAGAAAYPFKTNLKRYKIAAVITGLLAISAIGVVLSYYP